MTNLFQYTKTEGQGWLVEKPEMEKPELDEGVGKAGYYYRSDYIVAKSEYEKHIATLRRFKYDYPDPGKEMELGKDFATEVEYIRQFDGTHISVEVAIPIIKIKQYEMNDFDKGFLAGWEACEREYKSNYPSPKINK